MRKFILAAVLGLSLSVGMAQSRPGEVQPRGARTRPGQTQPARTRPAATQAAGLDAARKLYWQGKYEQAIEAYKELCKSPAEALAAAKGLAEAYAVIGKYDEAAAALRAGSARAANDAEWHVLMSRLHATAGRYGPALEAARAAVQLSDDWAPALLCLGEILETVGKKKEAIEVYKGVAKAIEKEQFNNDPPSLVAAGMILDRIAILTGQKASEQAQNILHNYFQRAYQDVDKTYWPANLAAGMLLLEKHKHREADTEFKLAAKLNKRIPDALVGTGAIRLSQYGFEQALAAADEALKINPRHADARLLRAATLMMWRKFDQVGPELEKVLQFNPNHLEALSLMAALHVLTLTPEKAAPFIQRVEQINPNYAQLHEIIGGWLAAAREFEQAEEHLKKAMQMAPELAGPVTDLGQVYMQTGREDLARQTLEKAFAIDDFRADVLNYLRLLEKMDKYSVKETEHFIIKVDGRYDEVLLEWIAEVAERIHQEVCRDFKHDPVEAHGGKTLVELFPNHQDFSVRITGRGWIGTIGACTGRVIAMPAPDPLRGSFKQFNWYAVLRHEYTHTVTLSATRNRIPHWLTEACAVWEQPDRRNFPAVALLVDAVRNNKLYPVAELNWGFIRPQPGRGRTARTLAYAQSEWIFEYVQETKRPEAVIKMLEGFQQGWTQQRVFKEVLGVTEAQFDKEFAAWARQQVVAWGFDPEPVPKLAEAAKAAKADPESAKAQADLAAALYPDRRRRAQAEAAARKALDLEPDNKRALAVLGTLLEGSRKYDEAIQTARRLEQVDARSATAAKILAQCYVAKREWTDAIIALEKYKAVLPLDAYAYEELANIYMQLGRPREALPNLIELHRRTLRDPKYARQAADIYRASDAPKEAVEFYEQVLQINPYDTGVYKAMASLCLRIKDYDQATRAMRSASLLEPQNAETWAQLAMVYYRVGRAKKSQDLLSKARQAAQKALELDPDSYGKEVLELIDQVGKL